MRQRKSWRRKLGDCKDLPKVVQITGKMISRWGTGTVVVPAPIEVDALRCKRLFVANYARFVAASRA